MKLASVKTCCRVCGSIDTTILNEFRPEPEDTDQRSGYQCECNDCEAFWDIYDLSAH